MNKRIRELALQAGFKTDEANCSFGNYKADNEYFIADDFIEDELKKFSELLIKDCAQYIEDKFDFCGDELLIAEKLKEHFGVE